MEEEILNYLSKFKLKGMHESFMRQKDTTYQALSFEERLFDLLKSEDILRSNKKITYNLVCSKIKNRQARLEDLDYSSQRGLSKSEIAQIIMSYIPNKKNIIITGPTGVGKSFLSQSLASKSIYDGYTARYYRFFRLLEEVDLAKLDSSYGNFISKLSRFNILVIDDFGINPLTPTQSSVLLDIIEERTEVGSTIITSQLPVSEWYSYFNNPTVADAILDRLVYNSYKIELKGESMRKIKSNKRADEK
jgi:DNA replication protein DnaC